ncbi:D-aminoacylase, partial [bacterium]|nr:D-aminoacylase [bacterium]
MSPIAALLLLLATVQPDGRPDVRADSLDVLIRRGTVYDGSGSAARVTDIGLRGDRIVFVGDAAAAHLTATRTIDAQGLIVAPGFIDPHTHSYEGLPNLSETRRKNVGALMQGV